MNPRYIIIHHSASPQNTAWESVNSWHKGRGFPISSLGFYIGYHWLIGIDYVKQARATDEIGAHAYGWNDKSIGICLTGNYEEDLKPTQYQEEKLYKIIRDMMREYNIPESNILLHRDTKATACPGKHITKEYILELIKPKMISFEEVLAKYKKIQTNPLVISLIVDFGVTTTITGKKKRHTEYWLMKNDNGVTKVKRDVKIGEFVAQPIGPIWVNYEKVIGYPDFE